MRVLVAGELNPDLVLASLTSAPEPGREVVAREFALRLGSSSAICASGLAKLGNDVAFLGTAGDDAFGTFCVQQLTVAGVDVSLVRIDPSLQTGLTVSITGRDRALVSYPGAMEDLRADDVTDSVLACFDHLHVSAYFLQRGLKPGLPGLSAAPERSESPRRSIPDTIRTTSGVTRSETFFATRAYCS